MVYFPHVEKQLREIFQSITSVTSEVRKDFLERVDRGNLLRSDDPISHFCVYFVPIIPLTKKVFLGHHTKANSWIAPGGHIEPEHETPVATVIQEAGEELGVELNNTQISEPFFLSVMDVFSPNRACRRHYSIWYCVLFEKEEMFTIEEREFYDTRWMSISDAKKIVVSKENLAALSVIENVVSS